MATVVGTYTAHVKEYKDLRHIIAKLLRSRRFWKQLWSFDDLSRILALAIDSESLVLDQGAKGVNAELLTATFSNPEKVYTIEYSTFPEFDNYNCILFVSLSRQIGSARDGNRQMTTARIGCFSNQQEAISAAPSHLNIGAYISKLVQSDSVLTENDNEVIVKHASKVKSVKKVKYDPVAVKQQAIASEEAKIEESLAVISHEKEEITKAKSKLIELKDDREDVVLKTQHTEQLGEIEALKLQLAQKMAEANSTKARLDKLERQQNGMEEQQQQQEQPQDDEESTKPSAISTIHVIKDGRAAQLTLPAHGIITVGDIEKSFVPLSYGDSPEMLKKRQETNYDIVPFGAVDVVVPKRATITTKGYMTTLKRHHAMILKLKKLFSGQKCRLSPASMRMIIAFSLSNFSGSDEGLAMALSVSMYVVHIEMELELSPEALGFGSISESTLRVWRNRLAAELFVMECYHINARDVKYLHAAGDHGLRNEKDAFCKGVSYGYIDEETGERCVKFVPIDFDSCAHCTKDVVHAFVKMQEKIKLLCPDVEFISIEGDNGGGGGVEAIFQPLIDAGFLVDWATYIICGMHADNKCIETGCLHTTGRQGRNMNTALQLGYASIKVFKRLKMEGGIELLDEIKAMVVFKLIESGEWQEEATRNNVVALDEILNTLNEADEDALLELIKFERNLQEPVWTRWKTTLAMAKFLKENWTTVYFMLAAVSDSKKTTLAITKTAQDALSLMKVKAKGEGPPLLFADVVFMTAIGDSFFNDMFETQMRANPKYGSDSYGFTASLQPVLVYYWRDIINKLRNEVQNPDNSWPKGSWRQRDEFKQYRELVEKIPNKGAVKEGGKEFYLKMPRIFIDSFLVPFKKHIEKCWRSEMLFPYLFDGPPELARLAINWLVLAESGTDMEGHAFTDPLVPAVIELSGYVPNQTIKIDTAECMEYLTHDGDGRKLDTQTILNHQFVRTNKTLLYEMGSSPILVDLCNIDTWGDTVFTDLVDSIHRQIAPHLSQNQRLEQQVQAHAKVSQNNTGEARRSADARLLGTIKHPLNKFLVEKKRDEKETQEDKDNVKRVRGRGRVTGAVEFCVSLFDMLEEALANTDPQAVKRIIKEMGSTKDKASAEELEQQLREYESGINGQRKNRAGENRVLSKHITSQMGGTIVVSKLFKTRDNTLNDVQAEINFRGITPPKPIKDMKWKEVLDLLRKDEYINVIEHPVQGIESFANVKEIVPQSDELKQYLVSHDDDDNDEENNNNDLL